MKRSLLPLAVAAFSALLFGQAIGTPLRADDGLGNVQYVPIPPAHPPVPYSVPSTNAETGRVGSPDRSTNGAQFGAGSGVDSNSAGPPPGSSDLDRGRSTSPSAAARPAPPVVYVPNAYAYTYGSPPRVIYAAPPPVYYAPPPVYYAPAPVYVAPPPVFVDPYYSRPHYGFSFSHFGRHNGIGFGVGF